jgi:glycosyltransferase involved in cell wall biosynthesis
VRWLRGVVAITDGIADDLVDLGFRRSMIKVLPDAVDLRQYVDLPSRNEARRSLGLPLDRPLVGYVGRFQTMGLEKGLHQLVKAIDHLEEPISMVAVGGPLSSVTSYLEQPGATDDLADRCWFFDRVPPRDVPTWIAAFDVVTIPWPDEPHFARYASPMKLFEYLAAGAAIVASDLPAIREVLTDRKDSWLVTPGDPLALAEGIRELLSDPLLRDRLGEEARTRSFAFSWEDRARAALEGWVP